MAPKTSLLRQCHPAEGGGATYTLSDYLDDDADTRGHLVFTAYIDAMNHDGFGVPLDDLPVGTQYHINFYQQSGRVQGSGYYPLILDGVPTNGGDYDLDVHTTAWGATAHHKSIDNLVQVIAALQNGTPGAHSGLKQKVSK